MLLPQFKISKNYNVYIINYYISVIRATCINIVKYQKCMRKRKSDNTYSMIKKKKNKVQPGWCSSVDWVQVVNQRVASSIPSQGTCLGCRPGPQWGHIRGNHTPRFLSLSFSLSSSLSKNK